MKKVLILIMTIIFTSPALHAQIKVGGIELPATQTFQGETVVLNGAGVREKVIFDLYVAGLYLSEKTSEAGEIINAERPMSLRLHIVSNLITSDKMIAAVTEGFEKSTKGNITPIQKEINTLLGFFKDDIRKNDIFDLVYLPTKGIIAYKNSVEKGIVPGKEFKKALFGIWLSGDPADDDLKAKLLSR